MTTHRSNPEYRIVIPGKAASFRSPKARAYRKAIRQRARRLFPRPLPYEIIDVRMDYFHMGRRRVDMDNVAKCVLDALTGVAYADDKVVRLQTSAAYPLDQPVRLPGGPVDLIKPLARHNEYLFIRIEGHRRIF